MSYKIDELAVLAAHCTAAADAANKVERQVGKSAAARLLESRIGEQFNDLDQRNDIGQLWENFVVIERLKYRTYAAIPANMYFWLTYDQQEIDLVEERDGRLFGYECKWSLKKPVTAPRSWVVAYPEAEFSVVHPKNYQNLILFTES